jgi:hypothetical protein
VLDPGVLRVGVPAGILVGAIGSDLGRDFLGDDFADLVFVFPINVAEGFILGIEDVAEAIQPGVGFAVGGASWDRLDLDVFVR